MFDKIDLRGKKQPLQKNLYLIFRSCIIALEALFVLLMLIYKNDYFIEEVFKVFLLNTFKMVIGFIFIIAFFIFFPCIYIFLVLFVFLGVTISFLDLFNAYQRTVFIFSNVLIFSVFAFVCFSFYHYKGFFFSVLKTTAKVISKNMLQVVLKYFLPSVLLHIELIFATFTFRLFWIKLLDMNSTLLKLGFLGLGLVWIILVFVLFIYLKNYYFFVGVSFLAKKHNIYNTEVQTKKNKKLALFAAIKTADKSTETILKATKNNLLQLVVPKRMFTFPNSQALARAAIYKKSYEESLDMTKEAFSSENLKRFRTWNLITTVFLLIHFLTQFSSACLLFTNVFTRSLAILDSEQPPFINVLFSFSLFALLLPFFSFVGGIASCQLCLVVEAPEKLKKINKRLFKFFKNEENQI